MRSPEQRFRLQVLNVFDAPCVDKSALSTMRLVYQAATVGAKQVEREPASADTFGLLTD